MKTAMFTLCVIVSLISTSATAALVVEIFDDVIITEDGGREATGTTSSEFGIGYNDVSSLAKGQGKWIAARPSSDSTDAWGVVTSSGSKYLKRTGGATNYARGVAYVYHSSKDITGSQAFSFDYKKSVSNLAYYVWGIQQSGADWGGSFLQQSAGNSDTDDTKAARFRYKIGGGVDTNAATILAYSDGLINTSSSIWKPISTTVDFGAGYDWIIIAFGNSGFSTTSNIIEIDNVTIPEPATMAILGLGGLALLRKRK